MLTARKFLAAVALAACAVSFAACNTMQGLGKDLERGGERLENKAADVQRDM